MDRYPNIVILLNLPQQYIPKAEFVLRTFSSVLRLNPMFVYGKHFEGAHIYYGLPTEREYPLRIHFTESDRNGLIPPADFYEQRELYPLDGVDFCQFRGEYIPFLFSRFGAIFAFNPQSVLIRKDIVASGFYFLTCWHEFILSHHGQTRGRVDFRQSLQYRWDFTDVPVVDVYCQLLLFVMERYLPQFIREIRWGARDLGFRHPSVKPASGIRQAVPAGRFAISLSHDIDYWDFWSAGQKKEVFKYNLRTFFRRPHIAAYKILGHTLHKNLIHDPCRQMSWILSRENRLGVDSTWFIFGKDDYADPRQNYISDPQASGLLGQVLQGKELGLHGSPESAYDPGALQRELDILRSLGYVVRGYRSHYLNFDYQKSFQLLEDAGLAYDSTLGYWEHIGFRAGISFPFFPFNIEQNRPFRVLEIPLIVMDTTLYSQRAMNLRPGAALRQLSRLINRAQNYGSQLSLLWHNVSFDPIDYPLWSYVYWSALRLALQRGAWITSLQDIYLEWTSKRN